MASCTIERKTIRTPNDKKHLINIICNRCGNVITSCLPEQKPKQIKCINCETKYGSKFVGTKYGSKYTK